jgi:hypothetical protein
MARYFFDNRFAGTQQNIPTTSAGATAAIASVWSLTATLRRGRCVAVSVGADGPPNATDCQIIYQVQRQTADGTGTTATPNPRFPGDSASSMAGKVNYTVAPTFSLIQWSRSLNQRASMQWAAQDYDAMILWPATNLSGLTVLAFSPTYATAVLCGIEYEDL